MAYMVGNARKQCLRFQPFAFFVCVNGINAVAHLKLHNKEKMLTHVQCVCDCPVCDMPL